MGLGAALVDRARPLRKEPTTARVEGTTRVAWTTHEWFRARLFLGGDAEGEAPQSNHKRVLRTPTLLCGRADSSGAALVIQHDDRLEVDSAQLGRAVWEVTGEPEPLRKRRTVIGYQLTLRRVVEHGLERL